MNLADRLALSYSALLRGLFYPGSESDSPYEPFSADTDLADFSAEGFRSAAHLASWWRLDVSSGRAFVERLRDQSADPQVGNDPAAAAAYEHLQLAMQATLHGRLHAVTARAPDAFPFHRTRHYVIGAVSGGGLAGVLTRSVET